MKTITDTEVNLSKFNSFMRIYVIGNGPSATRRKLGKIIDSGFVVRINNFQIAGFSQFLGTKTDLLFTCRLNEYFDTIQSFKEVILCLLMDPLDGVSVPPHVLTASNISEVILWPEIDQLTKRLRFPPNQYPSTGLICILKMIKRFGFIHILGFDNFKNGNLHYFDFGSKKRPPRHDGNHERSIIQFLEKCGFLRNLTP